MFIVLTNVMFCLYLQITSSAASDLNIKGDSKAIIRGNEGVNIMGRTVEFKMGGGIELRAVSLEYDSFMSLLIQLHV